MKLNHRDFDIHRNNYFDRISLNLSEGVYQAIGKGSARTVYDLGNGRVVKAARSRRGLAQNEVEYWIALNDDSGLFAHVIAASGDFRYLVMEKANRINDISYVWEYFQVRNNRELLQRISRVTSKYNLMLWDFGRAVNWGLINGRPVIIDFGFTRQVSRRFYRRSLF